MHFSAVAPPRGERGLKLARRLLLNADCPRRSPSWGAWIETRGMGIVRTDLSVSLPLVGSVD